MADTLRVVALIVAPFLFVALFLAALAWHSEALVMAALTAPFLCMAASTIGE